MSIAPFFIRRLNHFAVVASGVGVDDEVDEDVDVAVAGVGVTGAGVGAAGVTEIGAGVTGTGAGVGIAGAGGVASVDGTGVETDCSWTAPRGGVESKS